MNPNSLLRRPIAVLTVLYLLALCANGYWIALGRPSSVANSSVARIACVSYAPYRLAGESPFDPAARVSAERIETDLTALSKRFNCVRTYSVGQGLDQVPAIAARHHMKVLLGVWLSRDRRANDLEMTLARQIAASQHDTLAAIVVGNEVLLRGELSPEALAAQITAMRNATDLPVTYADVWEFWLKYPQIAPVVSFITIHILPYWEDHPVPIEDAVAHVAQIRAQLMARFPGRDILIGETGWPSAGRERAGARPSLVNQARFIREFLNWAGPNQVRYNVIEAFDQPWKRLLEGTAGGYWGIYDAHLHEKFAQQGEVIEDPHFVLGIALGALFGLVLVLGLIVAKRGNVMTCLAAFAMGDGIGACAAAQIREMVRAERTPAEWAIGIALSVIALASALWAARIVLKWTQTGAPPPTPLGIAGVRHEFFARGMTDAFLGGLVRFVWLYFGALMNLLLIFDGRYRDFPIFLYAAPVAALSLVTLIGRKADAVPAIEEQGLSLWLVLSSVVVLILETPQNPPAVLWVLMMALLGAPGCVRAIALRLVAQKQQRARD